MAHYKKELSAIDGLIAAQQTEKTQNIRLHLMKRKKCGSFYF